MVYLIAIKGSPVASPDEKVSRAVTADRKWRPSPANTSELLSLTKSFQTETSGGGRPSARHEAINLLNTV